MTDRHCSMEHSVKKVSDSYDDIKQRLALLEGKFATATFSTSSTRTTESGGQDNGSRPAIVVGGWVADQSASETYSTTGKRARCKSRVGPGPSGRFCAWPLTWFCYRPVCNRPGEPDSDFRRRIRDALRRIRGAEVITGERPQGGHRYFWAAMSESPERRKRAQFAGKVKRLVLEMDGDRQRLDVEFSTGNIWYGQVRVASAVSTAPSGATSAATGWIHLGNLARQMGDEVLFHPSPLSAGELHVITWNVRGDSTAGKHASEKGDIQIFVGKRDSEWRGDDKNNIFAMSGHMPHHATLQQAEEITTEWQQQLHESEKAVLGWDANETFHPGLQPQSHRSESGRGEQLLVWLVTANLQLPPQKLTEYTFFPYDTEMRSRRLDYVCLKHTVATHGTVLHLRDLARSDHEPVHVTAEIRSGTKEKQPRQPKPWGTRQLRHYKEIDNIIANYSERSADPLLDFAEMAVAITKPGKPSEAYRESKGIRQCRREILTMPPENPRKQAWKQLQQFRRGEQSLAERKAAPCRKGYWKSKKAVGNDGYNNSWELGLRSQEHLREDLQKYFNKIFCKRDVREVRLQIVEVLERISRLCKKASWHPFTEEELTTVRKRWKNVWRNQLLYILNDFFYVGNLPNSVERGITVLLAKKPSPSDWGDTRPITLSSVILKTFSQLIIQGSPNHVQLPSRLQWGRRHRQGVELILLLRKVCRTAPRTAHDWGIPMFLAKLDTGKAFDSVYQEAIAEEIARDVGEAGGQPWEARAWVTLLHAQHICITFRGKTFELDQSNGVRQGSPDSPIAFGRTAARTLDDALTEASSRKPQSGEQPPENGGSYMDDTYIWTTCARHMQKMLNCLNNNCHQMDWTSTRRRRKSSTMMAADTSSRLGNNG
ncbi:pol [Symbiodinium sp. CCMP2592]|nr:pol [Symbiodinium sp. CCMP2592]